MNKLIWPNELIWPNFHFRDSKEDFYTCLRYLKLDTRWVGSFDRETQVRNIHSVLHEVQIFSGLKSMILIASAKNIVQDALEEYSKVEEPTEWWITCVSGLASSFSLSTIKCTAYILTFSSLSPTSS
jgi:hypothetical protein